MKQVESLYGLRLLPWSPQVEKRRLAIKRRSSAHNYVTRPDVRLAVFNRDGFTCCHCGSTEHLSIDHIVSVYRGGSNDIGNLQTLCRRCNSGKAP